MKKIGDPVKVEVPKEPAATSRGAKPTKAIHDADNAVITPTPDHPENAMLALAMDDRKEVRQEIRAIESCRTLIFLGTFAAVGTTLMATSNIIAPSTILHAAALQEKHPTLYPTGLSALHDPRVAVWMIWGAALALIFLSIGILATVLKVRQINVRRAFLMALEGPLCKGIVPSGFIGWTRHAISYFERREMRDWLQITSDGDNTSLEQDAPDLMDAAQEIVKNKSPKKRLVAGVTASFTALSTTFYAFTYTAIMSLLVMFALATLHYRAHASLIQMMIPLSCGIGLGLLSFYGARLLGMLQLSSPHRGWPRRIAFISTLLWLCVAFGGLVLLFTQVIDLQSIGPVIILGPFAALGTMLTCLLHSQFSHCRKGKHSTETLFFLLASRTATSGDPL